MWEIKFRGMLRSGEWVYGGYVKIRGGANCILSGECDSFAIDGGVKNTLKFNAVKYKTVGKYTGLKDKNGIEIYEGDIFHWIFDKQLLVDSPYYCPKLDAPPDNLVDNISLVKIVNGNTILETDDGEFTTLLKGEFDRSQMGEVIGNIWENGELICSQPRG